MKTKTIQIPKMSKKSTQLLDNFFDKAQQLALGGEVNTSTRQDNQDQKEYEQAHTSITKHIAKLEQTIKHLQEQPALPPGAVAYPLPKHGIQMGDY